MEVPVRLPALWARSPVLANINSSNPPPPLSCMSGFLERSTVPNKQAWLRKVLSDNHVS